MRGDGKEGKGGEGKRGEGRRKFAKSRVGHRYLLSETSGFEVD